MGALSEAGLEVVRRRSGRGPVERATRARLARMAEPDQAVAAAVIRLAEHLDDQPSAAGLKELRSTVEALALADAGRVGAPPEPADLELARVRRAIGGGRG